MSGTRIVNLLFCLLTLSACTGPTQFTSSLSDPGSTRVDARLPGVWYAPGKAGATGGSSAFPASLAAVVSVERLGDARLRVVIHDSDHLPAATVHASEIDGETYYNATPDPGSFSARYPQATEPPHFLIFQIEFLSDDEMYVWMRRDHERDALKGRRVQCCEDKDNYYLVEESREELVARIRDRPERRFFNERLGPFLRVATPSARYAHWAAFADSQTGCTVLVPTSFAIVTPSDRDVELSWSGECRDGRASGEGVLVIREAGRAGMVVYQGPLVRGEWRGPGQCRELEEGPKGLVWRDWAPCEIE